MRAILIPTCVMGVAIAALVSPCAQAAPSARPAVIVMSADGDYAPYDRRIADQVTSRLKPLARFRVVAATESEPGYLVQGDSRLLAIAHDSQAQIAVVLTFNQDPQAYYSTTGDGSGRYTSAGTLVVRVYDVEAGHEQLVRTFPFLGESPGSRELAEYQAMDRVVLEVVRAVQDLYRLETHLAERSGRSLKLSNGEDIGLQEGTMLAGVDAHGLPVGSLRVTRVASRSADAQLLQGYYDLTPGATLSEQPYAGAPGGMQLIRVGFMGPEAGTFTGASLAYNRSGVGWGADLDFGPVIQAGCSGFALVPRWVPQLELWPERAWLYGELGGALSWLTQPVAGATNKATSYALSLVAGAGLALNVGPVGLNLGATYWSPWQASSWRQAPPNGATTGTLDVSSQVPHPILGGWGWRAGLGWNF